MQDEYLHRESVAHDLKNLITRACLAAEARGQTSGTQMHKQPRHISGALEQAATLCISECDAPVSAKSFQTLASADIKQLLREAVQISRKGREQSTNRIACNMVVNPGLSLTTDQVALFRILFNLTSNALNAMAKSGGTNLSILVRNDANQVVFDLIDSGPGLPDRILAFLFPHANGHPLQRGRLGTGLMSAVSLASELGGDLSLVRSDASGTAFRVSLPTSTPNCPMPQTRRKAQPTIARRLTY